MIVGKRYKIKSKLDPGRYFIGIAWDVGDVWSQTTFKVVEYCDGKQHPESGRIASVSRSRVMGLYNDCLMDV